MHADCIHKSIRFKFCVKMNAFRAFSIFLNFLIILTFVKAKYDSDYDESSEERDPPITDKLNEIEEKLEALNYKLREIEDAEYRNVRQWAELSEKEYELQQTVENINDKIVNVDELKRDMFEMNKNFKDLIKNQREISIDITDLNHSEERLNENLEKFVIKENQKINENFERKINEVVKLLEVVQKDQNKLSQQSQKSTEQCSKMFLPKLETHFGSLNEALQEKNRNFLQIQNEMVENIKKNTEKIDVLASLIQKSFQNNLDAGIRALSINKNALTLEQLRTELHDFNETIMDLNNSMDTLMKFSLFNITFDCSDALKISAKSGVYKLNIAQTGLEPFEAYCMLDGEGGDGWTVIQRRLDGSVDFERNWNDYKNGFGNLSGEYWLGLEKIHALTSKRPHMLRIELTDFEGGKRYAKYSEFEIGNENEGYYLKKIGDYSGNADDDMPFSSSKAKFSTHDVDNDTDESQNCAVRSSGGWWFDNCDYSVLNGIYNDTRHGHGINWSRWKGYNYSLKNTIMAIRAY